MYIVYIFTYLNTQKLVKRLNVRKQCKKEKVLKTKLVYTLNRRRKKEKEKERKNACTEKTLKYRKNLKVDITILDVL
jgi:hypothetical protein